MPLIWDFTILEINYLQSTNLIGIGKAGLSFVNFVMSKDCTTNTSTLVLNKRKPPESSIGFCEVFCEESSAEVNYAKIAEGQDKGQPSLIVFSGAGKFSGDAAIRLNKALELNGQSTLLVVIGPFKFEGEKAQKRADDVLDKLKKVSAIFHYLSNQDIFSLISPTASFEEGFAKMNSEIFSFCSRLQK
jgi:hypothetical protein